MSGPRPKTCATCARAIAPGGLYYRFSLVLEGEQDVLAPAPSSGSQDELASLLKRLEQGDESAQELEDQVHWERSGVVCPACRALVLRALSSPPDTAGPH